MTATLRPFTDADDFKLNDIAKIFGLRSSQGHKAVGFFNCEDPECVTEEHAEDLRTFSRACMRAFEGVANFAADVIHPEGFVRPTHVVCRWYYRPHGDRSII